MTTRIQILVFWAHFAALSTLPLAATAVAPRPSPELVFVNPTGGGETRLSSYRGQVVLIEFMLTNCPHCRRVAEMVNDLKTDLGPRGFQPIGIAFENDISPSDVRDFISGFHLKYPVAYTTSDQVDRYLGRTGAERLQVPQIVVVDRFGTIRAQSRPVGETTLEDAAHLHSLIKKLLKENSLPDGTSRTTYSWLTFGLSSIALLALVAGCVTWAGRRRQRDPKPR